MHPPEDSDGHKFQNDEITRVHLWDYVQVVLQRLPLATSVFVGFVLLAALYTWTRTPLYRASARLLAERGQVNLTDIKGAYDPAISGMGQREFMQTQVELIKSRPVVAAVLDKANLLTAPDFRKHRDPVAHLTEQIQVLPLRNTHLIDIAVEREDPRQAQRIVNALVDAFMEANRGRRLGISEGGLRELQVKAESLRNKLDTATRKLQDFMVHNNMVSLKKTQNVIVERLRDLSRQLTAAELKRIALQARVEAAEEAIARGQRVDGLPDVINSSTVRDLKMEMAELERNYSQMIQRLGENHPQLKAMSTQIDSLRTKLGMEASAILTALGTEYEQALKEETLLRKALEEHEAKVLHFNELAAQYNLLQQSKASIERAYQTIIRRIEEIDINRIGGQGENLFVIARAALPRIPSWPHKARNMVVAIIVGAMLAVGMCFFLDYMDVTVKGEPDVRHALAAKVIGWVPDVKADNPPGGEPDLICRDDPKSHSAEAFRALRTALAFSGPSGGPRTIVVSSTLPEEGKSLVSINLAIAEAQIGRKTLLIDSDMRKPRLHRSLGISPKSGLSDLLAPDPVPGLEDVVLPTNVDNLHFLPCGNIPSNPVEILDSVQFDNIIEHMHSRFDMCIFDSPPGLSMVDSLILGKHTDGLILVVRSFVTPKGAAQHFVERIHEARVPLLGVVLNNVDLPKSGYHYGAYYYGRYTDYYFIPADGEQDDRRAKKHGLLAGLRDRFKRQKASSQPDRPVT